MFLQRCCSPTTQWVPQSPLPMSQYWRWTLGTGETGGTATYLDNIQHIDQSILHWLPIPGLTCILVEHGTWNGPKYSVKLTIVFIQYFFNQQISGIQTEVFYHFQGQSVSQPRNSNYKGLERIKTEKTRKFFDKLRASYPPALLMFVHSEIGEGFSPKIFHHVC